MDNKQYTTCEMLMEMSKNRNMVFKRVGDERFKIFSSQYGVLMMEIDDIRMEIPILNYMQELWIRIE